MFFTPNVLVQGRPAAIHFVFYFNLPWWEFEMIAFVCTTGCKGALFFQLTPAACFNLTHSVAVKE